MVQGVQQAAKRIGWWHFELDVPRDWDIVAQGKSRDVEVFRLADSARVRLEVSLERLPFEKAKSAEELLEAYKRSWEKRVSELRKKEGVEAELKHAFKEDIEVRGHKGVLWGFRLGGAPMIAAVWYCEKSERSVAVTFMPVSMEEKSWFVAALSSAKCHYAPSERALWSTLLFDVRLPLRYKLAAASFTALTSFCVFEDPDASEYLLLGYSGLASVVMARYKKGPREWFEKSVLRESLARLNVSLPRLKYSDEGGVVSFYGETFSLIKSKKKVFLGKIWLDQRIDRIMVSGIYFPVDRSEEAKNTLQDVTEQMRVVNI